MTCQYSLPDGRSGRDGHSSCTYPYNHPQIMSTPADNIPKTDFMRKSNPTTQHPNILHIITNSGIRIDLDILLYFSTLSIIIIHVGFCCVCWVCVGFVLGFAPFCWVLNVNFGFCRSVKSCKCWVSKAETQQKPTLLAAIPNKTQQNPTNPTGGNLGKNPLKHCLLTIFTNFNVGLLGLFCRKHIDIKICVCGENDAKT